MRLKGTNLSLESIASQLCNMQNKHCLVGVVCKTRRTFMREQYQYTFCVLTIKSGNHLTASMCNSLLDEQHKNASHHSYSHNACPKYCTASCDANISGKDLFLSVAPSVLPPVSWTLDKVHLHIHNWIVICFRAVSWWNIQPSCFSYNNFSNR